MQNREWKAILNTINNEINFAQIFNQTENNIIDIIKSKLRKIIQVHIVNGRQVILMSYQFPHSTNKEGT